MRRVLAVSLLGMMGSVAASAATPTLAVDGKIVRWANPRLELAANPANQSGLSASSIRDAAVRGLERWRAAAPGRLSFDYWQGSDRKVFETNSNLNGHSSLYFASQSLAGVDPQVLGLTQVWFSTETGRILETDIVLNDVQFRFSTQATDTTGYGSGSTSGTTVFLENVLTHELGHAFGLSHSGVMQSTMLFMESPDQNHLGCDDQVGLQSLYGAGEAGAIQVRIRGVDGRALLGANVLAISRRRGTVLRSALSDRDGVARITGLEAGEYDVMAEPYYAGASPLSPYYAGLNHRICPNGLHFKRTWRTEAGSQRLAGISVSGGLESDAGELMVSCQSALQAPSSDLQQRTVLKFGEESGSIAALFQPAPTTLARLRIESSGGDLTVRLLSFSLYSPVQVRATLWTDQGGVPRQGVLTSERAPLYVSESGFKNFDTEIRAQGLVPGVYWLELTSSSIPVQSYPAGSLARDGQPFFAVQVSRGELPLTDSRCRQDESFAEYQSPPGDPPRRSFEDEEVGFLAGCGTVQKINRGGSMELLAGFVPWGFALWMGVLFGLKELLKRSSRVALAPARA